jgi:hypothetical protein
MKYFYGMMIILLGLGLAWPGLAVPLGQNDQEVQAAAKPVLDGLLSGFNEGDYQKYSQDFDDTLKEAISQKEFTRVRDKILKDLGKYQSRTYLGFLRKGQTTLVLWKGRFAKAEDDVLIKLVASQRQGKTLVVGLWFQ